MRAKLKIVSIMAVCFCALFASPAQATLITIEIEGVVDSVSDDGNYLEGKIKAGDIIRGFYVYESTTPDSSPLDTVQGNYWHYAPPAGIALNVGGFNFLTDPFNIAFRVSIRNDNLSGDDIYSIGSSNNLPLSNGTSVESIWWQLNDNTGGALSSDALPSTSPILNQWQANVLRMETDRTFLIHAHVTSAIPEPATIILMCMGGLLICRRSTQKT